MKFLVPACLIALASGACTTAPGTRWLPSAKGPEDLVVAPMAEGPSLITGTVFKSAFGTSKKGRLQAYTPGVDREFRTIFQGGTEGTFPFSPIGISLVENSRDPRWPGATLLYATNKARKTVEVFEIRDGVLVHRAPLPTSSLLSGPNGIAAFPDGSVYVSHCGLLPPLHAENPRETSRCGGKTLNTIIGYSPHRERSGECAWKVVAEGFRGCNGIAPGPKGKSILVASLHSRKVWAIPRDPKTGELWKGGELVGFSLSLYPDNLKLGTSGCYEIAGHKNVIGGAFYLALGLPVAPSSAMSFRWDGKSFGDPKDRSELLKGHDRCASTAIRHRDALYVGQPKNAGVLMIPLEK